MTSHTALLSEQTFGAIAALFQRVSGIRLGPAKRALVSGRLQRLASDAGSPDIETYARALLAGGSPQELVRVVDKLTTNETYFFREPQHFEHLSGVAESWAARRPGGPFRVWSAASSSGEEAFSIAMVLADRLGWAREWTIIGTDLSSAMVEAASTGLYPLERAQHVPDAFLKRFCRKGEGAYAGKMLVNRELRERVRFGPANLMETLPDIGSFDIIFLRNVLIYFDAASKAAIVRRVLQRLKPGGQLCTGHAESLNGLDVGVRAVGPAVYERS